MNKTLLIIFGCIIIFVATTLGATIVFFLKKEFSKKLSSIISGFSAGIMIAASFFSLILPSIEYADTYGKWSFLPATIGILIGCIFLHLIDIITQKINSKGPNSDPKLTRFIVAFTVHNIPEGMAVGFALGNALIIGTNSAMVSAVLLAVGIAIQNIPEGIAVALPVYKATKSRLRGFIMGTLSGIVEPIFAVFGLLLASHIQGLLSWSLSFSAGAMLFVSLEDLVPDAKFSENSHLGTWSLIVGFVIMMVLDLCL